MAKDVISRSNAPPPHRDDSRGRPFGNYASC